MKIIDLTKEIEKRFQNVSNFTNTFETILKGNEKFSLSNLDSALLIITISSCIKGFEAKYFFEKNDSYINILVDSFIAKYFAPHLFKDENHILSPKETEELKKIIKEQVYFNNISRECLNEILKHELFKDVDLSFLDSLSKSNEVIEGKVKMSIDSYEIYSFALSQTEFKLIDNIVLTNNTEEPVKEGKLLISLDPDFLQYKEIEVPLINPHQSIVINDFEAKILFDKLIELNEKVIGTLTIKFKVEDSIYCESTLKIYFYSYDTWFERIMNGSTALFVTPNTPAINNILGLVSKELQTISKTSSITEYQTGDKNEVVNQIKAAYNVLHKQGIAYVSAPPSYEGIGQKIRLPNNVLTFKQGTCLDLSILLASVLENIGLHPFIVLIKGHAFLGCFLEEDSFSTMIYNDAAKALEMNSEQENDIIFVECTAFTASSPLSFEEACHEGRHKVAQSISDPAFQIIDITKARANGFLPLPINYSNVNRIAIDYEVAEQNKIRLARKSYSYKGDKLELSDAQINRFDVWEKKLLDLSKRNQLINFKPKGHGLQILYYDLNDLYKAFESKTKNYSIIAAAKMDDYIFDLPPVTQDSYKELKSEFEKGQVSLIFRSDVQRTSLRHFERERKKAFEETGSNILFMGLGCIQYFETQYSQYPCYAPIILLPIDLIKHSKDSYSICGREEPPFLNISIFEFLHQEFGLNCDDLLTQIKFDDVDNVDVDVILNTVASKIGKLSRCSVIRTAIINTFNFSKAVMWSDVRFRKKDLLQNKIIRSIIDGRYACDNEQKVSEEFDDDHSNPSDFATPLASDSSQLMAIADASKDRSFILQGPPGTGKSQTITNMIVNAIYHGKTVLFVAEKMAALQVVQKRLNKLCLGKFALEAHSAKAEKSALMTQFDERISLGATKGNKVEFLAVAEKLKKERMELNRTINLLHKSNKYFMSFYDAFVHYLDIKEDIPIVPLEENYVKKMKLEEFEECSRLCEKLDKEIEMNDGYSNNPFIFYNDSNYVPGLTKRKVLEKTRLLKGAIYDAQEALDAFNAANGTFFKQTKEQIFALYDYLKDDSKGLNCLNQLLDSDLSSLDPILSKLIDEGKVFNKSAKTLNEDFEKEIYDVNYEKELQECNDLKSSGFLKKKIGFIKQFKEIQSLCKKPNKYKEENLIKVYTMVKDVKDREKNLANQISKYPFIFGNLTDEALKTFDFEKFEQRYLDTKYLIENFVNFIGSDELKTLINKSQTFSIKNKDAFLKAVGSYISLNKELEKGEGFDFSICEKLNLDLNKTIDLLDEVEWRIDYLPNWCSLLNTISEVKKHKLDFILDFVTSTSNSKNNLGLIFNKSIFSHIIEKSISGDESGSFNSIELDQHVEYYKKLIDEYNELTIKETAARVSANMPSINDNSPGSSQQGILNKAVRNKCRGKSIRQLFSEVPDILTKIFPIFLMSPISCAQYLSPDMPKFDVVIFDEASQMPTSEAIGAIARGKNLIVVGDSKQMPPTAFFQNKGSDDLSADIDDQESILDDCDVIGLPSRCLNWHYRSKHESLIRFSNVKFYKNNLVTFPSPNDMTNKVSFVNAKGVYGGSKATNVKEAEAIIKEIERRLKDPELSKYSIGVVTFSQVQQEVIEDKLQDFFSKNKELEKKDLDSGEPIIVKNLENIQGDERDVILFSVCYGPDKDGKMYYRFGPLNNVGGEKRLNVAVSRARYEMMIFASFEPEKLGNMKTDARGAQELYNFLKYAKYGSDSLILPNGSSIETKVGFEKHIAEGLKKKGYKLNLDVGKSSFRVDIGVINPKNPNEYILGVLCDSYSYENAITSKDRNLTQPNALSMLGWNLMRVWSFDYLDNPNKVINDICNRIEELSDPKKAKKDKAIAQKELNIQFEKIEVEQIDYSKDYVCYEKTQQIYNNGQYNIRSLCAVIKDIMEIEAPISEDLLKTRLVNAIGAPRSNASLQSDLRKCLLSLGGRKNSNFAKDKVFFWRGDQTTNLTSYRKGPEREIDDVPKEEIFVAIKQAIGNGGPMFKEELIKLVSKLFDVKVLGKKAEEAITDSVDCYLSRGELIMIEDGKRIALKEGEITQ